MMGDPPDEWMDRLYAAVGIPDERHPRCRLTAALRTLDVRESDLLVLRFRDRMSYKRAGAHIGLSANRANQITLKALRKLRHPGRWDGTWSPESAVEELIEETLAAIQADSSQREVVQEGGLRAYCRNTGRLSLWAHRG
jgi:hypothetical protein